MTIPIPQLTLPAVVIDVFDGDTCEVEVQFRMRIRLLDCWAPELSGSDRPLGLKARDRLIELSEGKKASVVIPFGGNDLGDSFTFGRPLARLVIDGKDISEIMVKEGFATKTKQKKQS